MTNQLLTLSQTIENVVSEISVDKYGRAKFSARATGRICDVNHKTLIDCFNLPKDTKSRLYNKLVDGGFDPSVFGSQGIPDLAVALIVDYYANEAGQNCTEFALQAQRAFCTMGIRNWCQKLVGWSEDNPQSGSVDTFTVESMFQTLMEKITTLESEAKERVERLNKTIEKQELLLEAKTVEIDQMKQDELIRQAKLTLYPGLKEAVDKALAWNDQYPENHFTLKIFCRERDIQLTNGQMQAAGKMATDFCRIAKMQRLTKNNQNHTLYSERFEAIVQVAVREVLGLNNL